MIDRILLKKALMMWAFLFFGSLSIIAGKTVPVPDFAYPQSVNNNAEKEMQTALKSGDAISALRSAIEITISNSLISQESVSTSAKMLDSLSNQLSSPYSSLALLLEAELYSDAYSQNRSKSNQKESYYEKVSMLIGLSVSGAKSSDTIGIESISSLLESPLGEGMTSLSLYDFVVLKSADILEPFVESRGNIIPFSLSASAGGNSAQELRLQLLDENISLHDRGGLSEAGSIMELKRGELLSDNVKAYWEEKVSKYAGTEYAGKFIRKLVESDSDTKNLKRNNELITTYLSQYSSGLESKNLQSLQTEILSEELRLTSETQYLPGRAIEGKISSKNLFDFYLLAVKVDDKYANSRVDVSEVKRSGKVISVSENHYAGVQPEYYEQEYSIPGVTSGVYVIVASKSKELSGLIWDKSSSESIQTVLVSNISIFKSREMSETTSGRQRLYVVNGETMAPIAGAQVTFTPTAYRNKVVSSEVLTTDADGSVLAPSGNYSVIAKFGGNICTSNTWTYGTGSGEKETLTGTVFTNLSIYRPGEKVKFSVVAYTKIKQSLSLAQNRGLKVTLLDANYQKVDSLDVTTDVHGRVSGEFEIPQSGLLGRYFVRLNDGKKYVTQTAVMVSEYKSPTIYVNVTGLEDAYQVGDLLTIKGKVSTYTEMPVTGAKVKYTISSYSPWRFRKITTATYEGEATADESGIFRIELPTEGLRTTEYSRCVYRLDITATNGAGETVESDTRYFSIGAAYTIVSTIPDYYEVGGDNEELTVSVRDMMGSESDHPIYYKVTRKGSSKSVETGSCKSGVLPVNFENYKSGEYVLALSLDATFAKSDEESYSEKELVVYRRSETKPAGTTALWLPKNKLIVSKGTNEVVIPVGSSYTGSYIYAETATLTDIEKREWLKVSNGIVRYKVSAPQNGERVKVRFVSERDLKFSYGEVELIPEEETEVVTIQAESFRDHITPGSGEKWRFTFSQAGKELSEIPVMAVLSNKALNTLNAFKWNFNPYSGLNWNVLGMVDYPTIRATTWSVTRNSGDAELTTVSYPEWNTYDYTLYGSATWRNSGDVMYVLGAHMLSSNKMMLTESAEEAVLQDSGITDLTGSVSTDISLDSKTESLRDVNFSTAFFEPNLLTDEKGNAVIEFVAPAFVGTLQLQVLGYTSELRGAVSIMDVLSTKPVMVQLNTPRFVRTGDKATFEATVYNNSEEARDLICDLIAYDPLTGAHYATSHYELRDVPANSSRVISLDYEVGTNIEQMGLRVRSCSGNFTDGEQTIIAVSPSSSPVIESQPIYLASGDHEYTLSLPEAKEGSVVTLTYTENPVWECVTALPGIVVPKSENVMSQALSLYANSMIKGLAARYPEITDALAGMQMSNPTDSTLISNLSKDESLKKVMLNNTPWVMDAQSETSRMLSLVEYSDKSRLDSLQRAALSTLQKLQDSDGGWSWCPDMSSSRYVTMRVLYFMGLLSKDGYLPAEAKEMASRGISYIDSNIEAECKKIGQKSYNYSGLLDYLYIRSLFGEQKMSAAFSTIKNKSVAKIKSGWKSYGIYNKSTAALVLHKEGYAKEANAIISSLKEYSSTSREKGMWYDNLNSERDYYGSLVTTAHVLDAISEILPGDSAIGQLRQWLIISKQTENWGESLSTAEVIQSILGSGSDWKCASSDVEIMVGSEKILTSSIAKYTGRVVVSLQDVSGELKIKRSGDTPAWGGVITQMVLPIEDVKESSLPQLSITKNVSAHGMNVGDKVCVTLTLKCDRNMEYVTITDERAACLEPTVQTSGSYQSDGVWMYKEVRNQSTNLFIPYLSKGTHVISYECYVDRPGIYTIGIATAQSQYSPVLVSHSSGDVIEVSR